MTLSVKYVLSLLVVVSFAGLLLQADVPQVPTNTWASAGTIGDIPVGAASATLPDGRVLIAGGENAEGARTATIAIYDPARGSLEAVGEMTLARSYHSATALGEGKVAFAGGYTNDGLTFDVEVFDVTTGSLGHVGDLSLPLAEHGAALLKDGRMLVAGGFDGTNALSIAEIFDPETGSKEALTVSMETPRRRASVTALLDGHVLIAGGNDGSQNLASAELFDLNLKTFFSTGAMTVARSGHSAILLPHNNRVLISGGVTTTTPVATAELYADHLDGFTPAPPMSVARLGAVGGGLTENALGLVVGGGSPTGEFFGYATVKTDKDDYLPGERVTVFGSGWQAGETVRIKITEDADTHHDFLYQAVVQTDGTFSNNEFAPIQDAVFQHAGVRFYVTVTGVASTAINTFTDGRSFEVTAFQPTSAAVNTVQAYTLNLKNTSTNNQGQINSADKIGSICVAIPAGQNTPTGLTASASGWQSSVLVGPSRMWFRAGGNDSRVSGGEPITLSWSSVATTTGSKQWTVTAFESVSGCSGNSFGLIGTQPISTVSTALNTTLSDVNGSGTYGSTATLTATLTANGTAVTGKSLAFTLNGSNVGSATTNNLGVATLSNVSLAGINAGSYTTAVVASFSGDSGYVASGPTAGPLSVAKATPTVIVTLASYTYDGTAHGATGSVTGVGGADLGVPTLTYVGSGSTAYPASNTPPSAAGTYAVTGSYSETSNYAAATASPITFTVDKANATVDVSGYGGTYDGAAHGATGTAKGVQGETLAGLNLGASFTNVPGGSATWTFTDATGNYNNATGSAAIEIGKANATVTVNCTSPQTYTGSPIAACTATATGAGGLNETLTVNYADNVNVGTATGSASFGGDGNHTGDDGSATFVIDKATSTVTVNCTSPQTYTGSPIAACTATVAGAGGLGQALTVSYSNNVNVGTATGSASYAGDANHTGDDDSKTFAIEKATSTVTVSCESPKVYTGSAIEACTASVAGAGGLDQGLTVSYSNNVNVGTATGSASYAGDANHTGDDDSKTFAIEKATSTVTVSCESPKVYTGSAIEACTASVAGAGGLDQALTVSYSNNVNVGTATGSASYAGDANHTGDDDSKTFAIEKATSTVTVTCASPQTYTGSAIEACTASVAGAGGLDQGLTVSYSNNVNVGTATGSASYAGDANHTGDDDSKTFAIEKATSTVTVTCASPQTYTGSAIEACTASVAGAGGLDQGLTVSYSNNVNVGTATGSASYAGDANHTGDDDSKTFAIEKATSTVTVTCASPQTYTGSAIEACTASVAGAGGLDQGLTVSYSNNVNVGTATGSASYAGDANHTGDDDSKTFAIEKATSTVTVTCASPQTYTGSAIEACTASVAGAGGLDQGLTVSYSNNVNVGTATGSASYGGDANHTGDDDSKTFAIEKATSTVTVSCESPKVYTGSAIEACTAAVAGAGGLDQALTVSYSNNVNVGTATGSASYGGDANHTGDDDSKTFAIEKATSTVTVNCESPKVYTGSAIEACTAAVAGAGGLDQALTVSYTDNVNVGTATGSASYEGDANHKGSTGASTFEIGKKPVTGSFTADNKVYDATTAATVLTRSLNGVVNSDSIQLNGGTATFDNKNVGSGKTVTLTGATLSGAAASNYALSSVSTTTANITKRDVTVTATAANKIYDGTTTANVELFSNKLPGDTVLPGKQAANFADKNVGENKTVTVTDINISGPDAGNYNLMNTTTATTANILPKGLKGKFTAANKAFDNSDAATIVTRTVEGAIGNDIVNHTGGTAKFNNPIVGNNKPVTLTGATLVGADAANYQLDSVDPTSASILPWDAAGKGFYQPVGVLNSVFNATTNGTAVFPIAHTATVWNTAKGGSTIPLKFNVYGGGVELTGMNAFPSTNSFTLTTLSSCASGASDEVEGQMLTTGSTSLRYDTTDLQWIQTWKTPGVSKETCYRASVTFADGSTLSAFFKLRK